MIIRVEIEVESRNALACILRTGAEHALMEYKVLKHTVVKKENKEEERKSLLPFEDSILELIDHWEEINTSDLQGAVTAIVWKIFAAGKESQR